MKKNYLRIVARGEFVDSDYFIDLKDLKRGKEDLVLAISNLHRKSQEIEKIAFCENLPGAW